MIETPDCIVLPRFADMPRDVRERLGAEKQRGIQDDLTRRHVADAEFDRHYATAHIAKSWRVGPAQSTKLVSD